MNFFIRLTAEEKNLAESYAKTHDISLNEAVKQVLLERIEDENDVTVANGAYSEFINSGKKSRPIFELWHELNL